MEFKRNFFRKKSFKRPLLALGLLASQVSQATGGGSAVDATELSDALCEYGKAVKQALDVVVIIFAFVGCFLLLFQYFQGSKYAQSNFVKLITGLAIYALSSVIIGIFITGDAACDLTGGAAGGGGSGSS